MRLLFLRCAVSFVVFSLTASLPAAGQAIDFKPPAVDIPEARRATPLPQDIAQIQARLDYIAKAMRDAKGDDAELITAARKALVVTFKQYPEAIYRNEVARQSARIVTPLLALPGSLRQVNAAMALSEMPYATIQPALEQMVVHPNTGVRFLGWKGYRGVLNNKQLRSGAGVARMFRSLTARVVKETSPRVLGAIWDVLRLDKSENAAVDRNRVRAMAIMKTLWRERCGKVLGGDVAMSEAVRQGILSASHSAWAAHEAIKAGMNVPAGAKALRRDGAQMIVDVMYCAAKAYGKAFRAGEVKSPAGMAAETLLWEGEKALNNMLGLSRSMGVSCIRTVMNNPALRKTLDAAIIRWVHPRTGEVFGVLGWVERLNGKDPLKHGFELGLETPTMAMFVPKVAAPGKDTSGKDTPGKVAPGKATSTAAVIPKP